MTAYWHLMPPADPSQTPTRRSRMRTPIRRLLTLTTISACVLLLMSARADASTGSVRKAICDVFGPRCAYALRIARCESNLDPKAIGGAGERSLFQIHPVHFGRTLRSRLVGSVYVDAARLFDPAFNSRVAYVLSNGGRDWSPWTCRRYV